MNKTTCLSQFLKLKSNRITEYTWIFFKYEQLSMQEAHAMGQETTQSELQGKTWANLLETVLQIVPGPLISAWRVNLSITQMSSEWGDGSTFYLLTNKQFINIFGNQEKHILERIKT
jgi:hypothetical protein